MKRLLLVLLLAMLCLAASYHEGEVFKVDKTYEVNVTAIGERVILTSEYYTEIIRDGDCQTIDVFEFCIESVEQSIVEYWPHEYEINMTVEKLCKDCSGYGGTCEEKVECEGWCVHGTCRPTQTWCGDDVCDEDENGSCSLDCPLPEMNETNTTTLNNSNTTDVESSVEDNSTTPTPEDIQEEDITVNTSAPPPSEQQDQQVQADSDMTTTTLTPSGTEVNYVGVAVTISICIGLLIYVFMRRKKKPRLPDLDDF